MTFKLGLTGSIGMGKSTTAQIFVNLGCDLWDADEAVHRLYSSAGAGVAPIAAIFPEAIIDGEVSRSVLKSIIANDTSALSQIEAVIHPLVFEDRKISIEKSKSDIIVLDIPLLFEKSAETLLDATVCVYVSTDIQKDRVLNRGNLSHSEFLIILDNQMLNTTKCELADYTIKTDTIVHAQIQAQEILKEIRKKIKNA
jgi:dephospho-CoA kinase